MMNKSIYLLAWMMGSVGKKHHVTSFLQHLIAEIGMSRGAHGMDVQTLAAVKYIYIRLVSWSMLCVT